MTVGGALAGQRRWTAAHPRLADAGPAALLVLAVLPTLVVRNPEFPGGGSPDGWPLVLFALAAAALVLRRERRPAVWAFATSAGVAGVLHREREMVALVAHRLSNEDIAARLHLSPLTVKTHVNRAMSKLDVRDRAQLVVLAYRTGLVRPDDAAPR